MKITHIEKWKVVVPMRPDTVNSPEYDSQDGIVEIDENVRVKKNP